MVTGLGAGVTSVKAGVDGKGGLESESPVVRTSLPQAGDGKDGAQAAAAMLSEQDRPGCREVQTRPHVEKPGGRRQGA